MTRIVAAWLLVATIGIAAEEPREWKDRTGGFTTTATMVDVKVVLEMADGRTVEVPLSRLSDADKDYVHRATRPVNVLEGKVIAVADGDTVTVLDADRDMHKIRLTGIDAPEGGQAFGTQAKQALSTKIDDREVRVEWNEMDHDDRRLGDIYFDGRWVNHEMVAEGWAWYDKEHSNDSKLAAAEVEARKAKVGLWADADPTPPWDYRNPLQVPEQDLTTEHAEQGLGLTLEQFKEDIPIGESWNVLTDKKHEDGTATFQLTSTTMRNHLIMVAGNPKDLREVSYWFGVPTGQNDAETINTLTIMACFLAKYSNWTEVELALFWRRYLEVGGVDESELRIQKDGHEFWMTPMAATDGAVFVTGVSAKPHSTAPTLQSWLDGHPLPVPAGLNRSTVNNGVVAGAEFSFKGFRHKGDGDFIGEITNDSNRNLQMASFTLSIYDMDGVLVDTAAIIVSNLGAGQTRSFDAYVEDMPGKFLYKIDFNNGL